ncbi:sialate O-acetylesterase [soil metagenome]
MKRLPTRAAIALCMHLLVASAPAEDAVKVFVLAGQSNMEGKVQNKLLEHQARDEKTRETFAHLRDGDSWRVREDVWIKFFERHGGLTIGYGSPDRTGLELEFGTVMGDKYAAPVLLIKVAWGGRSLFKDFRPPSAGLPPDPMLDGELASAQKRVRDQNEKTGKTDPLPTMDEIKAAYGSSYRIMIQEVEDTIANLGSLFPALEGKVPELAGFVWFQGWNDQYGGAEAEYASNLQHLIRDLRNDLDSPALPVVIGVMGQNGSTAAEGPMLVIQEAQLAMQSIPEFKGNVRAVPTDLLVDKAAESLFPTWKENVETWEKTGSDYPYHYLGSALWHLRIGHAMAEAMLELSGKN